MYRKVLIISILLFFVSTLAAQINSETLLNEFKVQNKKGMLVLGTWSLTNIVSGSIMSFKQNDKSKYFWQMNAAWNSINLTIAAFGYFGGTQNWETTSDIFKIIENYKLAYLFNAGLDLGYIMTGFYLYELSKRKLKHAPRLSGYGQSLILQGSFLLLFDFAMFAINQHHYNLKVVPWIDTFNAAQGITLSFSLY